MRGATIAIGVAGAAVVLGGAALLLLSRSSPPGVVEPPGPVKPPVGPGKTPVHVQPPGPGTAPRPIVAAEDSIVVAGDSLAVGLARPLMLLSAGHPYSAIGVGGTLIRQWAGPAQSVKGGAVGLPLLLGAPGKGLVPDVVLLSLGTNDGALSAASLEAERLSVDKLIDGVCSAGIRLVWLLPPNPDVPRLADVLEMIDASPAVDQWAQLVTLLPAPDVQLGYDRIHPTPDGYAAWAQDIWERIT